jgi:hypothetical protein
MERKARILSMNEHVMATRGGVAVSSIFCLQREVHA